MVDNWSGQRFELRCAYSLGKHVLVLNLFCAETMEAIAVSGTFYKTYLGIIIVKLLSSTSFDAGKSRLTTCVMELHTKLIC